MKLLKKSLRSFSTHKYVPNSSQTYRFKASEMRVGLLSLLKLNLVPRHLQVLGKKLFSQLQGCKQATNLQLSQHLLSQLSLSLDEVLGPKSSTLNLSKWFLVLKRQYLFF